MFESIQAIIGRIPKGKVATYGSVAKAAGYPGASRQVVWALRAAPRGTLPWHRVLAAKGRIALPGEHGFEQRLRLQAEGVRFIGARVDMQQHEFKFGSQRSSKVRTSTSKRRATKAPARRQN